MLRQLTGCRMVVDIAASSPTSSGGGWDDDIERMTCYARGGIDSFFPRSRNMAMNARITIDPAICHGKPCIRGLRYPVQHILEWLAAGMTIEEILADYEDLEREDILAALAFAARMTHVKRAGTEAA
ncbi:MAG: DUF433 domain-containing protein [Porticoccaceae bacterium]